MSEFNYSVRKGESYGLWTVIGEPRKHSSKAFSITSCRCACGIERDISTGNLTRGLSVGCWDCYIARRTKHGHAKRSGGRSREYTSWHSMIERCTNPDATGYENYGSRGITVCDRWRGNFKQFLEDMGPRPPNTSLERVNNEMSYSPQNCKWATRQEQFRNTRLKRDPDNGRWANKGVPVSA